VYSYSWSILPQWMCYWLYWN